MDFGVLMTCVCYLLISKTHSLRHPSLGDLYVLHLDQENHVPYVFLGYVYLYVIKMNWCNDIFIWKLCMLSIG